MDTDNLEMPFNCAQKMVWALRETGETMLHLMPKFMLFWWTYGSARGQGQASYQDFPLKVS